ncbi:PIN domain-containing protein [Nocardioides lijunqiniae]|uniref:PIN domain-containing protein n=1 Tax=Nocardioides lijunqiniae TaxID=2760832 RepID=UPI001877AEE9|nr:PIN domain-containing protein [Nocardioides lijunqiniae]
MDRRLMLWPTTGTGEDLAIALQDVINRTSAVHGGQREMVESYLAWVDAGVETLQRKLSPRDLERLLTSPRYWSIAANPEPTAANVRGANAELQHRKRLLEDTAAVIRRACSALSLGRDASLVLVDSNVWIDQTVSLAKVPWFQLVSEIPQSRVSETRELRLIVPILLVDELDGVGHRNGRSRQRAINVARWLHGHLRGRGGSPVAFASSPHGGEITLQLLMDPLHHVKLPNNDDELLDRLARLRDFIGHPPARCFFLTQDVNAALRAESLGISSHLMSAPERPKDD